MANLWHFHNLLPPDSITLNNLRSFSPDVQVIAFFKSFIIASNSPR